MFTENPDAERPLAARVERALKLASDNASGIAHSDGHWCGEVKSSSGVTAEHIFLRQALGLDLNADREAYCRYLLSEQYEDGSWGLSPETGGNLSQTVETYLALKILGLSTELPLMQRAREFVLAAGGMERVRMLTRFYVAVFGLFPWGSMPELPVELILMPLLCPANVYNISSWARCTIVPLTIVSHHKPVFALPNGKSANNDFLDELWRDKENKTSPYGQSLHDLLSQREFTGFGFSILDKLLHRLNGLRSVPYLRTYARKQAIQWMLERQEITGEIGGIFQATHASIYALLLEGYKVDDPPVRLGIEALEKCAWVDEMGKRIQTCTSPVWDTALMTIGLCDGMSSDRQALYCATTWLRDRQLLEPRGDWRVDRPYLVNGGWSFEYMNTLYPDVDDTAAVILAQVKHDAKAAASDSVIKAATWVVGMQNRDGGWAAFDVNSDMLFFDKIPFSDMGALCDPSCADITGRIIEALGLIMARAPEKNDQTAHLYLAIRAACARAINYLADTQEPDGVWFGRWGCNYIYGTSHALCGLIYFVENNVQVEMLVQPALQWLKSKQNPDGGWGESQLSYQRPSFVPQDSSPSQTAWALMALLAYLPHTDEAIQRGVQHLLATQVPGGTGASWPETFFTGTGFPNHFNMHYEYYRHYWPMMALGRYIRSARGQSWIR